MDDKVVEMSVGKKWWYHYPNTGKKRTIYMHVEGKKSEWEKVKKKECSGCLGVLDGQYVKDALCVSDVCMYKCLGIDDGLWYM